MAFRLTRGRFVGRRVLLERHTCFCSLLGHPYERKEESRVGGSTLDARQTLPNPLPLAMPPSDHDPVRDDDADSLEEGEEDSAAALETEADVTCPHCGETMTITLDPGGGRTQEYVEDCQVCCRPWRVRLWYDAAGAVDVQLLPVE